MRNQDLSTSQLQTNNNKLLLQKARDSIQILATENEQLRSQLQNSNIQNASKQSQTCTNQFCSDRVKQLYDVIIELRNQNKYLTEQIQEQNSVKEQLENYKLLNANLQQTCAQIPELQQKITEQHNDLQILQTDLKMVEALKDEQQQLKQAAILYQEEISAYKKQIQELISEQFQKVQKCDSLESELLQQKQAVQNFVQIVKVLETQLSQSKQKTEELQQQNDELMNENQSICDEISLQQNKSNQYLAQIHDLQQVSAQNCSQTTTLELQVGDLLNKIELSNQQHTQTLEELASYKKLLEDAHQTRLLEQAECDQKIITYDQQLADLVEKMNVQKIIVLNREFELSSLREDHAKIYTTMEQKIAFKEEQVKKLVEAVQNCKKTIDNYEKDILQFKQVCDNKDKQRQQELEKIKGDFEEQTKVFCQTLLQHLRQNQMRKAREEIIKRARELKNCRLVDFE
ncbi:Hypothetical_protein [Hexamita inflata]|uniref:Hypothetical_protein n=2 Tax=Hexamita inflata TaxID=28002 RepID=A0AA86NTJ8_9EUKA|nr:Hypothetical protein HINF_LOCUS13465 [Hexamita inflata]